MVDPGKASNAATNTLYRKLAKARAHDTYIDGAEQQAAYANTVAMVNALCRGQGTNARFTTAVDELEGIKRSLET